MQDPEYTSPEKPRPTPVKPAGPTDVWRRHDGAAVEATFNKDTGPTVTSLDSLLRGILKALRANGINPTTEETP